MCLSDWVNQNATMFHPSMDLHGTGNLEALDQIEYES